MAAEGVVSGAKAKGVRSPEEGRTGGGGGAVVLLRSPEEEELPVSMSLFLSHILLAMANFSSSLAAPTLIRTAEKLHRGNFLVRMQAVATQFFAYLDPELYAPASKLADKDDKPTDVPNPMHEIWQAHDSSSYNCIDCLL
ncbi:hypothetical protein TRIUR3_30731 [Triticum urartu]|uniref:Uncharacterized protein n=1 Tax=Triticum urartu TaxID=4572 RepID=M7ZG41_TRIUA|nr:hypothetical protein TRIUR3_30731 [Triticum urartu]